jgi:hypothetical protein
MLKETGRFETQGGGGGRGRAEAAEGIEVEKVRVVEPEMKAEEDDFQS